MLYIVTALYEEALPFFQKYNLKQKTDFPHFELFTGEGALLLVTRPGALRAAVALSSLLTAFPPGRGDFLLSVGCAGCAEETQSGKAFLVCQITEGASGRTRYPEMLYRCPFPAAKVVTQAMVQTKSREAGFGAGSGDSSGNFRESGPENPREHSFAPLPVLYDMEAAGIYEAAIPYFSCDRLVFVKVVSDALTGLSELPVAARRAQVTGCIAGIFPELAAWVDDLISHARPAAPAVSPHAFGTEHAQALGMEGAILFTEVCNALRLSAASRHQLYQLMLYLTLSEIPYQDSMRELLATPLAQPCKAKKEGLKYLEQLNAYYL